MQLQESDFRQARPGVKMKDHHDEVNTDIPELAGMVVSVFQKIVQLHSFITPFG